MVLDIIEYIGTKVLTENQYIDTFGANCINTRDGRVVNFIGREKSDFAPTDIVGIGSYARIEPTIEYDDIDTKKSSCKQSRQGSIKFRLVVFQVNAVENILNPAKLENKIWADLTNINFSAYTGTESLISLKVDSSNLDFSANFRTEVGKDYEIGADSIIVALNCTLTWMATSDNCEVCSVTGVSSLCNNGVEIIDQAGNVIAFIECGRTYTIGNLVPTSRTLTINGTTYDLSADRSWTISTGGESLAQTMLIGNSVPDGTNFVSATPGIIQDFGSGLYYQVQSGTGAGTSNLLLQDGQGFQLTANNGADGITYSVLTGTNIYSSTKIRLDAPDVYVPQETASTILSLDSSKRIKSLALATYPSLTELSYVKGVTSAIQTQINARELLTNKGAASGYAPLDASSKIPNTYLPALAITDTFVVASQAAMLALSTAETGDIAVRTDLNKSFILAGTNYSVLADWQELLTPTDSVLSVNGGTGAVTITITGTTNRITVSGGTGLTPTIDISATFEALLGKVASPLSQFAATTSAQLAGVISDETGSGALVFANTPSLSTPILSSATSNTAGALGYDGVVFYRTPNTNNPGLAPGIHLIRQNATRAAFANNTSPQALFDSVTNGALTLPVGTYRFRSLIYMSGMSSTSGNGSFSIAGGATTGSFAMYAVGLDQTATATPAAQTGSFTATSAFGTNTVSPTSQTAVAFMIEGTFQVTVAGTIIPSFAQTTATTTAVLNIGSFFECWSVGSTSSVSVGNWS